MKKMVLLSAMLLMLVATASAQFYPDGRPIHPAKRGAYYGRPNTPRHHSYDSYCGFRVGLGLATVSSESHYLDGNKVKAGLNAGFVAGTQLVPGTPLFVESGLFYTEKGGKSENGADKFTYNLNYLEMPLVMKYYIDIDRYCSIQPFLGGYVACGIGGKIKDFGERAAYNSFSDSPYSFRRMDAGLRTGCGLQIDMFYAELSYDLGLANICKDDFDTSKNGALMLSLGVNF